MENIFAQIALALSPFVVTIVTNFVKGLGTRLNMIQSQGGFRPIVVRFIAAILSFTAVTMTTDVVDQATIDTLVQAFLVFGTASATYFFSKR